ncbi:MAG: hypothetical protein CMO55_19610 [Verrucomicrobiales bacterium]|nr:hypothetical protein [Verrucomicrobiales bacterium]
MLSTSVSYAPPLHTPMSHSRDFQLTGYANVPSIFTTGDIAEMQENVSRYLTDIAPGLTPPLAIPAPQKSEEAPTQFIFLGRMDLHDVFFEKLRLDPRLHALAKDLLGTEVEAQHVQMLNIVPGICRATPPHQDAPIFSIEPNHAVTFWIPLSDVDVESGCLHYVPGSHWNGYLQHADSGTRRLVEDEKFKTKGVAMPVEKGGLVAHHCFTIHYSSENRSGENRWALAIHFFPVGTRSFDEDEWIRRQKISA